MPTEETRRRRATGISILGAALLVCGCSDDGFSLEDVDASVDATATDATTRRVRDASDAANERLSAPGDAQRVGEPGTEADAAEAAPDAAEATPDERELDASPTRDSAATGAPTDAALDARIVARDSALSDVREAGSPAVDSMLDASTADAAAPDARASATPPDASVGDASAADAPVETSCRAPVTFYRDRDLDGYGSLDDHLVACDPPPADDTGAWVVRPGDCRDDLPQVRPDANDSTVRETRYTGEGYRDPTKPGGVSFDINCDGVEDADPANLFGTEPSCPLLIPGCGEEGYVPASPERAGATVNGYCGSTTVKRCVVVGLVCRAELRTVAEPFRCH
jgi:hypothetical protein